MDAQNGVMEKMFYSIFTTSHSEHMTKTSSRKLLDLAQQVFDIFQEICHRNDPGLSCEAGLDPATCQQHP